MLRISVLLPLEQKISTGGLLLALGGGSANFSAEGGVEGAWKRGGKEYRKIAARC